MNQQLWASEQLWTDCSRGYGLNHESPNPKFMDLRKAKQKQKEFLKPQPLGEPTLMLEVIFVDYVNFSPNAFKQFGNARQFAFHTIEEAQQFENRIRKNGWTLRNPEPSVVYSYYPPSQIGRSTLYDVEVLREMSEASKKEVAEKNSEMLEDIVEGENDD